jgi:hypothetical protein
MMNLVSFVSTVRQSAESITQTNEGQPRTYPSLIRIKRRRCIVRDEIDSGNKVMAAKTLC